MSLTWFPASLWYLNISDSVFPKSFHAMNFKYCMHERYSSPVRFLGLWCNYYHAVFHQALPGSQISVAVAYKQFKHGFFSFTYRKYIKVHVHRYENLLIPKHRLGTRFSSCSKLAIMILFITYCPMILQLYKVHCQATCTCTESCIMESSAVVLE